MQVLIYGSDITIKGNIIDGLSVRPLSYANISKEDGSFGTACDEDGRLIIVISQKSHNLIVSYIGYKARVVNINSLIDNFIVIPLHPKDILLQGVSVYRKKSAKSEHIEVSSYQFNLIRVKEVHLKVLLRVSLSSPGRKINLVLSFTKDYFIL